VQKPAVPSDGFRKRPITSAQVPSFPSVLRQETAQLRGTPDIRVEETAPAEIDVTPAPAPPKTAPVIPEPEEELTVQYLGEAFNTYLIAQVGEKLVVIDKHAAHERILYNKLKNAHQQDAQVLLTPVPVSLSHRELEALQAQLPLLNEAGFEAEEFDGALLVRTVPMMLTGSDVPALMQEIAAGFLSGKQEVTVDRLSWIYHSVACKAAVKAGDRQSSEEAKALVLRVLTDKDVRYCPHGRPVYFELTKKELEKQFGRV
jgi:DNA mismatch repair protein MutL